MDNQELSMKCNILKILNIFMSTLYLMLSPLLLAKKSNYEGNESVAEGGENPNNDSSHTVHVEIP